MPVIKQRPHILQLLNIAVEQRKKITENNRMTLERPSSVWKNAGSNDEFDSEIREVDFLSTLFNFDWMLDASIACEKFCESPYVGFIRRFSWPVAFSVMAYNAPQQNLGNNSTTDVVFYALDMMINSLFMIDSVCRLFGVLIRIKIEHAYKREVRPLDMFMRSGFIDLIVTILCFSYGISDVGLWLRLVRLLLITAAVMEFFPQIDVLMSGISNGLKSIFFTIVVFTIILLVYASLGHHYFRDNDPFHFGTYVDSFITFFTLSTFDNWTNILYLNAYGCDGFPASYDGLVHAGPAEEVQTSFGLLRLPLCTHPMKQPIASLIIFISFAVIEGYVIVSMCLAAVAIGINERLESLRSVSLYGAEEEAEKTVHPSQAANKAMDNKSMGSKAAKLLGNSSEQKEVAAMLKRIWDSKSTDVLEVGSGFKFDFHDLHAASINLKLIVDGRTYELMFAAWIFGEALLQLCDESFGYMINPHTLGVHWMFQAGFLLDLVIRLITKIETPQLIFLGDPWTTFNFVLTVLLFVPLCLYQATAPGITMLVFLRLVRLVRILKTFSYITDLNIIMSAISSSYVCLIYVAVLVLLFFAYFAIAGVLLFKYSAPFYFASIASALRTLVQVTTQDGWSDVMRVAMYGCRYYGFDTGVSSFDKTCSAAPGTGTGVGYYAPIFFMLFSVIASMVLISLLVGVIITSMELLREGANEEAEIWAKVRAIQRRYRLEDSQMDLLLRLFERTDKNLNGKLAFEELSSILDAVKMNSTEQFEFFLRVDTDKSGQIDYSEFCEMIALIGLARKATQPQAQAPAKTSRKMLSSAADFMKSIRAPGIGMGERGKSSLFSVEMSVRGKSKVAPADSQQIDASMSAHIGRVPSSMEAWGNSFRRPGFVQSPAKAPSVSFVEPIAQMDDDRRMALPIHSLLSGILQMDEESGKNYVEVIPPDSPDSSQPQVLDSSRDGSDPSHRQALASGSSFSDPNHRQALASGSSFSDPSDLKSSPGRLRGLAPPLNQPQDTTRLTARVDTEVTLANHIHSSGGSGDTDKDSGTDRLFEPVAGSDSKRSVNVNSKMVLQNFSSKV